MKTQTVFLSLVTFVFLMAPSTLLFAQATVEGTIQFEGSPPPVEEIDVKSDSSVCGKVQEVHRIILGENQGIKNAVVKIIGAKGDLVPQTGKLDQVDCHFVPHVQVHPVGSTVKITSSDPVLHNSHGFREDGSTAFNLAVPFPGMQVSAKLEEPGAIKLRCDAGHTWMSAYLVASETPYFALTDENGHFVIENVPSGTYEIEVWHEWLGTYRQSINVNGQETSVDITLKKT